ncbi:MAG TPA: hypothetical protein ENI17_02840 [Pseudomonas xinjiangensis]|uniref:DoxX protein n=2 Tax=root TaxID=1 RepID=A0A7V1FU09_9GAMM|nr:hypothetical protein [Halopseudomonas xinjiangensis]HEC46545.1 hypothetical protein [Halopseudomonas xinjiangensis]
MPRHLPLSLLLLRLGIFIVFLVWTLDKLVNPEHSAQVFAGAYRMPGLDEAIFYVIGGAQLILITAFVIGAFKTWTYGAVMVFHTVSTLAVFGKYLQPFDSLLYFAAWPMLAACIALFLLRDYDTLTLTKS